MKPTKDGLNEVFQQGVQRGEKEKVIPAADYQGTKMQRYRRSRLHRLYSAEKLKPIGE